MSMSTNYLLTLITLAVQPTVWAESIIPTILLLALILLLVFFVTRRRHKASFARRTPKARSCSLEPKECSFRGVILPVIKDVEEFARIVREEGTQIGLLVGMDAFGATYGHLLTSVPDHMTRPLTSNPFNVDAENGPCRLVCAGCETVLPESFMFGLTAARAFRGGLVVGGTPAGVAGGLAGRCPKCGCANAVIVFAPDATTPSKGAEASREVHPEGRGNTPAGTASSGWGDERRLFEHVEGAENGDGASCELAVLILAEDDNNEGTVQAIIQSHPDFAEQARLRTSVREPSEIETTVVERDVIPLTGALVALGGPEAMLRPVYCCYGSVPGSERHYLMAKVY